MTALMLALVTDAYGGGGGIAQYNRELFDALGGRGSPFAAINILPRLAPGNPSTSQARVRQFPATSGRASYSVAALRHAIKSRPSVVFCGHFFMGPLAWATAKAAKARFVMQLHGIEIWHRPSAVQRYALEAADLVICVSRDTRAWVRKWTSISPERVLVVPNTVADDFVPGDRSIARSRFDLDDEDLALLSVGRLDSRERYKGHDRVLAELAQLPAPSGRNLRYLIAGDGDDRPRLEGVAKELGLAHVQFLGQVDRAVLPDLYRAADLFVLPSEGEGFGIVFIEAMASGTPAIGLAVGGAPDALGDGELGWCVEPDEFPKTLARAIATPRPDPHALAAKVQARFGRDVFRARVVEAFARL